MLRALMQKGFGEQEGLNCAERILSGANVAYNLNLDRQALKLASGFGGGMSIGSVCGALTASVMVLGSLYENDAHEHTRIKKLTEEFLANYREAMGDIDCTPLKNNYSTPELKCRPVVEKAAEILDNIVKRENTASAPLK